MHFSNFILPTLIAAQAQTPQVTIIPLSTECEQFVKTTLLPLINTCSKQNFASLSNIQKSDAQRLLKPENVYTNECMSSQKSTFDLINKSQCKDSKVASSSGKTITVMDSFIIIQVGFATACVPTANNLDYCVNLQATDVLMKIGNVDFSKGFDQIKQYKDLICTDCVKNQLKAIGQVDGLPSDLSALKTATDVGRAGLCLTDYVVVGKGNPVTVTSIQGYQILKNSSESGILFLSRKKIVSHCDYSIRYFGWLAWLQKPPGQTPVEEIYELRWGLDLAGDLLVCRVGASCT